MCDHVAILFNVELYIIFIKSDISLIYRCSQITSLSNYLLHLWNIQISFHSHCLYLPQLWDWLPEYSLCGDGKLTRVEEHFTRSIKLVIDLNKSFAASFRWRIIQSEPWFQFLCGEPKWFVSTSYIDHTFTFAWVLTTRNVWWRAEF